MRTAFFLGLVITCIVGCGAPTPGPFVNWQRTGVTKLQKATLGSGERRTVTVDARVYWAVFNVSDFGNKCV